MRKTWPFLLAWLAGCGAGSPASNEVPSPAALRDLDPTPRSVEVRIVAGSARATYLSGRPAEVWAYRDGATDGAASTVPGPILLVEQGDRVLVRFRNELPEPTTIHWHGLRVPASSDGTPVAQTPVPPGGSFEYQFEATDAGTFWYHPHVNGDVQVERGLYGAVVVRGAAEPQADADRVFILDDVKLEASGQLSTQTQQLDIMLGRQGNVLLVNGQSGGTLRVRPGARERWRFINSANGRYFNLRLPGHRFTVIAWDGGLLPEPYDASTLLIAPGERYEVLVTPSGNAGSSLALQTIHYDRGHNVPDPGPRDLFQIVLEGPAATPAPLPASWGHYEPIPVTMATPVRSLVLEEEEEGRVEPIFLINRKVYPEVPAIDGTEGDVEIWAVRNEAEMDHPFHLHGMFFQVLDVDGTPPAFRGWKDTVNVPQKKTLRFAVRYGTPGRWMYHCHILEHAERGMMGELMLTGRR